jgi:glycosyltransferase involved in cell wall biosynthesis
MNPPAAATRLLHIAPHAHGYGGIETLLRRHAAADARFGFDSWQLGLFEKTRAENGEPYLPQRFGWRDTPRKMRRQMAATLRARAGSVIAWHNGWGMPWFADLDGSVRRIACLQANPAYYRESFAAIQPWIDGALVISPGAAADALAQMPGFPPDRLGCLHLPLESPLAPLRARVHGEPLVLGCAGRLTRVQKRWDRLVPCVAELKRLGVRFRLEVIGRGPLEPWLKQQFRDEPNVQFLGFLENPAYWARTQTWDAALFFSDIEGGPLVMLEAMAAAAVPFYPRIGGSLGDDYAPQIDPRCYYPAGDPIAAARAVQAVFASPPAEIAARRIAELPRISRPPDGARKPAWPDRLPLGLITRAFPRALWR